jgi:hypothetical protein
MVSYTWDIFHTTSTDHDYRVLLEIMSFTSDIGDYFIPISQTDLGDLPESRVWLLRSTRVDLETDTSTLRS